MLKQIIPVILTKNKKDLQDKLTQLKGLANWVQIDIVDGKFANNKTIQLKDLFDIKTNLKLETHLMVLNPKKYLSNCEKANIKRVIFHIEKLDNPANVLKEAKKYNFKKGIALNPETPIEKIKPFLKKLDLVLILGVHPGFGGQKFIPNTLKKIKKLRKLAPKIKIEVDGGVNLKNAKNIIKAGADYLAVGSGIFKNNDLKNTIRKFKEKIQ